jgi:hypothetical protein
VRAELGEDGFIAASSAGRTLTLKQAVSEALEEPLQATQQS